MPFNDLWGHKKWLEMSVIIIWPVVKSFHKENIWLKDYLQIVWGFLVDICRRTYVLKDVVSYQIYRVVVKCYTKHKNRT